MEIFNMQLRAEEEEEDTGSLTEMVQRFMPQFRFEGEAAEIVGQAGLQPELGIKCICCSRAECKRTLICDACESSFHLECLKLRISTVSLLNVWFCENCSSSPVGGHSLEPSSCHQSTLATVDELCKRSSSSKRHRHPQEPEISQVLPLLGDKASKIRVVFKLKSSHFKGARALANEDTQTTSDRLTDESTRNILVDSAEKPTNDHVECLFWGRQPESADPSSVLSCQEAGEEPLVAHWIRRKKMKRAPKSVDSEKDRSTSCQMQSSSFDHYQCNKARSDQPENVKEECRGIFGILEQKATTSEDLALQKHSGSGLELVAYRSSFYGKQDDDVCRGGEKVKEKKAVDVPEDEREIGEETLGKTDMAEEGILDNRDCPMRPFVGADAHPKGMSGLEACPSPSGYAGTCEKDDVEPKEDRGLVWALDDAQEQLWRKDAIKFMDLEPFKGTNDCAVDVREALVLPDAQVCVELDTSRLLQAYAECRERCIIAYKMCTRMENHAETYRQTNGKELDLAIERTWSLGGGFYVLFLGSKEVAKEAVLNGTITFQGGKGYAVPYVPCFSPNEGPERACPVWVTFLHLPIYFRPFLQELAACLGKVLSLPSGEVLEASDSPRVCICWKILKCIPEWMLVEMEGLGSKRLKIEFDLSLLRHLLEPFREEVASTVPVSM